MTEQPTVEVDGELVHVHSELDVEAVSEVVVKRGRRRPRNEKPPKEKQKRGRPRKEKPPKEKKPIGRPRQIREPRGRDRQEDLRHGQKQIWLINFSTSLSSPSISINSM